MAAVAMGLSLGCGPSVVDDQGTGGATDSTSGGDGTSTDASSSSSSSSAGPTSDGATASDTTGDGPRFDIGTSPIFDLGEEDSCIAMDPPPCEVDVPPGLTLDAFCGAPVAGLSCEEMNEYQWTNAVKGCLFCTGVVEQLVCEPFVRDDMCCTWAIVDPGENCPGRPFVVAGNSRVPAVVERFLAAVVERAVVGIAAQKIDRAGKSDMTYVADQRVTAQPFEPTDSRARTIVFFL